MAPEHRGATSKPARRGFSLIELVVVVIVIAIASAVAVPRFASASARSRVDAATGKLIQDLGIVASSAQAVGADRQIVFDPTSETYVMMGVPGRGRLTHRTMRLGDPPYDANLVSASFDGAPLLSFNGYGLAETDGQIDLAVGVHSRRIILTGGSASLAVRSAELTAPATGSTLPSVRQVTGQRTIDANAAEVSRKPEP